MKPARPRGARAFTHAQRLGLRGPSIFLSASVPNRPPWVDDARPREVRDAVRLLCRYAFTNGYDLVFGGHPAITPMVLQVARDVLDPDDERPRVAIFQSRFFLDHDVFPPEALELAADARAEMCLTANIDDDREASLRHMRELMITAAPELRGAVYAGGMEGVVAINRFSTLQFVVRGWSVSVTIALLAFSASATDWRFAVLAYFPVLLFWWLDGFLLAHERNYRNQYNAVIDDPSSVPLLKMSFPLPGPTLSKEGALRPIVWRFHGALTTLVCAVWAYASFGP